MTKIANYRFVEMLEPLKWPVYCNKTIVIPAGAVDVSIAFRQSHLSRYDETAKKYVKLNVYLYEGQLYHA